jgi:hypothetical protein
MQMKISIYANFNFHYDKNYSLDQNITLFLIYLVKSTMALKEILLCVFFKLWNVSIVKAFILMCSIHL